MKRCVNRYYTKEQDALSLSWPERHAIWCNPPYSKEAGPLMKWVEHALRQRGTVVMLLLSDTGTQWFQKLWGHPQVEVRFLSPRVRFLLDGKPVGSPRFASIVAVIRG